MSKPSEGSEFDPILTPRFPFTYHGQQLAIVDVQLMPDTAAVQTVMTPCKCGKKECNGFNQIPLSPQDALGVMAAALSSLLKEYDAQKEQQKPGVN